MGRVSGRCTSVNVAVAVQAGPSNEQPGPGIPGPAPEAGSGVVGISHVQGAAVTVLAEVRDAIYQQTVVNASMGAMTCAAVFLHRRVFPEKRAALAGVTAVAEFIEAVRPDHSGSQGAVGVVTVAAGDLPLTDGMPGPLAVLEPDLPVAPETDPAGLRGCRRLCPMNGVTLRAGHVFIRVFPQCPEFEPC